jgi:hypothetical protein
MSSGATRRSRFAALRVRAPGLEEGGWLLAEWLPNQAAPSDYWLSNLPKRTPIVALVRLGKLRRRIEHDYRELKDAFGLDHYQGRSGLAGTITPPSSRPPTPSSPWNAWTQSPCVGLTTYQVLGELQILLACWTGACPTCHRRLPYRWHRQPQPAAPT